MTSAAELVDWGAALRLARLATPPGPRVPASSRRAVVAVLRRSVKDSLPWAGQITGMTQVARQASTQVDVRVVDRAGLQRATADRLYLLMREVDAPKALGLSRRLGATELAAGLGYLSTTLLGQVQPASSGHRTRLLLVAPNVLELQRRLELDVLDLPAWVALHETTHVLQVTAAPWLAGHLAQSLRTVIAGLVRTVQGPDGGLGPGAAHRVSLLRRLLSPYRAEGATASVLDRTTRKEVAHLATTLSLLEGHAEAVLDSVTPERMPSVYRLRQVLSWRRPGQGVGPGGGVTGAVSKMLRLAGKETQYLDGAAFVRAVLGRVGHEGLNRVWTRPTALPTPLELGDPEAWLERMSLA